MKNYLSILFAILITSTTILIGSCDTNQYKITGSINESFNGQNIMLFKFYNDSITEVDTSIITNGKFVFNGIENLDDVALISTGNYPETVHSAEVILEKGSIRINIDSSSLVTGSKLNDLYQTYYRTTNRNSFKIDSLISIDPNQKMVVGSELNLMIEKAVAYKLNFIKTNLKNPIGRRVLKSYMWNLDDSTFFYLYDSLPTIYKNETKFKEAINKRAEIASNSKERLNIVGKKFIDFELKTPENEVKRISDFVGKSDYMFIDFWASWCGPCVADIPRLTEIYNKYNRNEIDFIGISLDSGFNSWRSAIEKYKIPWANLSELVVSSEVAKAYYIYGIPNGIIINKKGEIIKTNVQGGNLEFILQELFNKN